MVFIPQQEAQIIAVLRRRGLHPEAINDFVEKWRRLVTSPATLPLDWQYIEPLSAGDLIDLRRVDPNLRELGTRHLSECVVIKLNGGRSTTMGGEIPKSLLVAKKGLTFLEITCRQLEALNRQMRSQVPLLLMNSFFTEAGCRSYMSRSQLQVGSFLQNEFPRLLSSSMLPMVVEENAVDDVGWAPAGHGDCFLSLKTSGWLDRLLQQGKRYALISNIDNLGAVLDPTLLGAFIQGGFPFAMEATERTAADSKGGTPVRYQGRLSLLEIAQVEPQFQKAFQDIERFAFFNTNNLWIDLVATEKLLRGDGLHLPIIQNRKQVSGKAVIQLETAMGAALGSFSGAAVFQVGRDRFVPVKAIEDHLLVLSDLFNLDSNYSLRRTDGNSDQPLPKLHFGHGFLRQLRLEEHFADPESISLREADAVYIGGDVFFEPGVVFRGRVDLWVPRDERLVIPAGTVF